MNLFGPKIKKRDQEELDSFVDDLCHFEPEGIADIANLVMEHTKLHLADKDDLMKYMKVSAVSTRFAPMLAAYALGVEAQIDAIKKQTRPEEEEF